MDAAAGAEFQMEQVNPHYELLSYLCHSLKTGRSIRQSLNNYFSSNSGVFAQELSQWMIHLEQKSVAKLTQFRSPTRHALLIVIEQGLQGQPILNRLEELKKSVAEASEEEMDEFIQRIPFLMLLPLMFFLFPSFLILLLGPMLENILLMWR